MLHVFKHYLYNSDMQFIKEFIHYSAEIIEALGVAIIVTGTIFSLAKYIFNKNKAGPKSYQLLRQELGRIILLGLEVLIAADIIATVVTELSLDRVFALGLIVLIRTFLSLSIEIEIEGKIPWKQSSNARE